MMRLKEYFSLLCLCVIYFSFFHWVSGFSTGEAFTLGILFSLISLYVYEFHVQTNFTPYTIEVGIRSERFLRDMGLEVPGFTDALESVVFTAINRKVWVTSDPISFRQQLYIRRVWTQVSIDWMGQPGSVLGCHPQLVLARHGSMYKFGVQISAAWWDKHRSQFSTDLQKLGINDGEFVIIGEIPAWFIANYTHSGQEQELENLGWQHDSFGGLWNRWLGVHRRAI